MPGGGLIDRIDTALPLGPLGERGRWLLALLSFVHENGADAIDFARVDPRFVQREPTRDYDFLRNAWATAARRLGPGRVVETETPSELSINLLIEVEPDRRFWLAFELEATEPFRILRFNTAVAMHAGLVLRRAVSADASALVGLERDAPIVLGDTTMSFEHDGGDYFEHWSLLDEPGAIVAEQHGVIVASLQSSFVPMRIAGKTYKTAYTHRVRTHPDHARRGLLQHLTRVGLEHMPLGVAMDALVVCIGKDNDAMQTGWRGRPGQWPHGTTRFLLDLSALRGGSQATPFPSCDSLDSVVDILNTAHANDEGYVPYTVSTFAQRLARGPHLYGQRDVASRGGAAIGVWRVGVKVRTVLTAGGVRTVQRRAIAADWGVVPGAEGDLVSLLHDIGSALHREGLTHLALFASPPTPGWDVLSSLATAREEFDMWTLPIPLAADATERGTYVDAIAF